jgi:hypothetical protein
MPPRASLVWRTCPSRRSSNAVGISDGNHVHNANTAPIGIAERNGCCTTWGTWSRAALTTSILRTLREIMDEVYRLFDRRCRTDTALAKLAKLRMRVRRFRKVGKTLSKLFSPNREEAPTFLDDPWHSAITGYLPVRAPRVARAPGAPPVARSLPVARALMVARAPRVARPGPVVRPEPVPRGLSAASPTDR